MLNMEVKGNLARLLATENIVVEHRDVETAMFNVKNRVLTLPMWGKASPNVYDMLVGHEVGHALYTPDKWGADYGIPQDYLNVVEDARIEKLMKRKFAGLARNFYSAYKELSEQDFFEIGDRSIDTFNLIDRINLYFKLGIHSDVQFSFDSEETRLVSLVESAETFEEVVEAARQIFLYAKEKQKQELENANQGEADQQSVQGNSSASSGESSSGSNEGEGDNQSNLETNNSSSINKNGGDPSSFESSSGNTTNTSGGASSNNIDYSETNRAFAEAQKKLIDEKNPWDKELKYVEIPKLKVETFVVPADKILEDCENHFSTLDFSEVDQTYLQYRSQAQREVNYLVKEFEMRKSADQYARSSVSKTGVLDTQKLSSYKWNEDIFKKISVVPDGKNHGLIFILDWSGSMSGCLRDTAKQLLNIAWFCKKTQIPFDVYAFTNDYWHAQQNTEWKYRYHVDRIAGYIDIPSSFSLLNMISSNGKNTKNLESQLKNFWRLVSCESSDNYMGRYNTYSTPPGYSLSGTPLNEAIVCLSAIIPDFKKRNKVQKTNVIVLTDGEPQPTSYMNEYHPGRVGANYISENCVLRDRTTGRIYPKFDGGYYNPGRTTQIFLDCLNDRFKDVNIIGIRLIANARNLNATYSAGSTDKTVPYTEVMKEWKKFKSVELKEFGGYKSLYVMGIDSLQVTDSFEVDDDATTKEIGKAFTKSLSKKSLNKKMLTSFAQLIS